MDTDLDSFEETTLVYTRLVAQISDEAAAAIRQIHAAFGCHAALRAALIIMILKMEVEQNHWVPHFIIYMHLIGDYPDAIPLAQQAMECCLQVWTLRLESEEEAWIAL